VVLLFDSCPWFTPPEQIYQLNGDIRRINKDLKVCNPQFSTDLQCVILRLRKRNTQKIETIITFVYIVTEYIQGTNCLSIGISHVLAGFNFVTFIIWIGNFQFSSEKPVLNGNVDILLSTVPPHLITDFT
jgi:hypothetical protein